MEGRNLYGRATGLDQRGKHGSFTSALEAAFASLIKEKNPFFDRVSECWARLFPNLPARPGRSDMGVIVLYVKSAGILFMMKSHLPRIKKALGELPGAPKRLTLRLEIHS